jgi:AP2 domain.
MKEVPLTRNKTALIDDDMYAYLTQWKWLYLEPRPGGSGYAARAVYHPITKRQKFIMMQNIVLPPPEGLRIDHIDLDSLNNQKDNLRICTRRDNSRNKRMPKRPKTISRFKGVYPSANGKWVAVISFTDDQGKHSSHLGTFTEDMQAARAYDAAALAIFGEFARLNLPG